MGDITKLLAPPLLSISIKNEKSAKCLGLLNNDCLIYVVCLVTGFLVMSLLWYASSRKRKKRRSVIEIKNMSPEEVQNYISTLENENSSYTRIINELRQELRELKTKLAEKDINLKKAEDTINELSDTNENTETILSEDLEVHHHEITEAYEKYLFFPSPLPDGSFRKVDSKATFLEGASIYRFKMISETEARFEFCDDDSSVGMALNNRADLILSVAEEVEGNSFGAKKILTYKNEEGKVVLEDNKWIVKKKVKIKYV